MRVCAVCVITCIPSEEWIAVPAYTDTIDIPDQWRSPVPPILPTLASRCPILQGPGYCQSRSTAIFPAADIYFRLLTAFRLHFSNFSDFSNRSGKVVDVYTEATIA